MLPPHHADTTQTAFQNPWPPLQSLTRSALTFFTLPFARIREQEHNESDGIPDTQVVDLLLRTTSLAEEEGSLYATWLGHAGFLLEFTSKLSVTQVICDPIFADRASPYKHFGPKRRLPPPCTVEELPQVHYVVISHNHYDHLDAETLQSINFRWPTSVHYIVPLGLKELLVSLDFPGDRIHELDWWENLILDDMEFVCTPAQHNSGRGILDQSGTLWASWVIRQTHLDEPQPSNNLSVWFAGDTGYQTSGGPCPAFKEIGEKYGPFDLALIPIWRGASLSFLGKMGLRLTDDDCLATLHATPEDALQMQEDVQARHALGMHFATFVGSRAEAREPVIRLIHALKGKGERLDWKKDGGFGVVNIGERILVPLSGLD